MNEIVQQLERVKQEVVSPRVRYRREAKVCKIQLLQIFLEANNPLAMTLDELTKEYGSRALVQGEETTQAIAKSLRDIDGWIDDFNRNARKPIQVRFNVNQIAEPLVIESQSDPQSDCRNMFLELMPAAVEKAFQPKSPVAFEQLQLVNERFRWLVGLFPLSLVLSAIEGLLDTVARSVSQLIFGRIRHEIKLCLLNSESVYYFFSPEEIRDYKHHALNSQIRTLLNEAAYSARLEASERTELGHIKNVAFIDGGFTKLTSSSWLEEFRHLRQKNQFVYVADRSETCNSPLPVLVVGNQTFVSFPSIGCPDAIAIEHIHSQFDSRSREFFRESVSMIDRGEAVAVDGTGCKHAL